MLDVLSEAPTANSWFARKKGLLMGEPDDITLDIKTLRKDITSVVATGALNGAGLPLSAGVLDVAVGRGGAGLGRQGYRRARALLPRADGAEFSLARPATR